MKLAELKETHCTVSWPHQKAPKMCINETFFPSPTTVLSTLMYKKCHNLQYSSFEFLSEFLLMMTSKSHRLG